MTKLTKTFISPKEALSSYLDDMLEDAVSRAKEDESQALISQTNSIEVKQVAKPKRDASRVRPKAVNSVAKVAEIKAPPIDVVTKDESLAIKNSVVVNEEKPAVKEKSDDEIEVSEEVSALAPAKIDWQKEKNFDCLLFKVDGLSLAVPMVLLGNIHPMGSEPLTALFDQPEWFLGLLTVSSGETIRVLDTAKLVMPERYHENSAKDLKYVIGVHGSNWGFGCHEIVGSATFDSSDIKWRKSKAQRPWLAGTVIEYMCALIDLQATNALMESSS